jgi:hypothetical protein
LAWMLGRLSPSLPPPGVSDDAVDSSSWPLFPSN